MKASKQKEGARSGNNSDGGKHRSRRWHLLRNVWEVVLGTRDRVLKDDLTVVAAGVAFFGLLGVIPGLAALISIVGLLVDPAVVQQQVNAMGMVIPEDAKQVLTDELERLSESANLVGFGAVAAILFAVWSGSRGVKALIQALNIVYNQHERRSLLRFQAFGLMVTVGGMMIALTGIVAIVMLPSLLKLAGLDEASRRIVEVIRWPLLVGLFMGGLTVLYAYGPNRRHPKWRCLAWGTVVATGLWIGGSWLFSFYVSNFANYNKTYGSLGAVVILLLWFHLTAFAVLLGAEINAEIEHRWGEKRERDG